MVKGEKIEEIHERDKQIQMRYLTYIHLESQKKGEIIGTETLFPLVQIKSKVLPNFLHP